jgi:tetratricopeptide (TPR) repeat protein
MRWRVSVLLTISHIAPAVAANPDAVAMVIGSGYIQLPGTRTRLPFRGEHSLSVRTRVISNQDGVRVAYLNGSRFEMHRGSEGRVGERRLIVEKPEVKALEVPLKGFAARLRLPERSDRPAGSSLREVRQNRAPAGRPVEPATAANAQEVLARALAFEGARDWRRAADHYARVAALWPEAGWLRAKLRELEVKSLDSAASSYPAEQTWAVAIGISRYPRVPGSNLKYANADAKQFADFLRKRGIPSRNVLELTDERATSAAVRHALDLFLNQRAGPEDHLVIFLAGHAVLDRRGAGYFLTYDSDPQDLASTAIAMDWLRDLMLERAEAIRRVTLFVDTCHAGALGLMRGRQLPAETWGSSSKLFALLAGRDRDVSVEGVPTAPTNGLFTRTVLHALESQPSIRAGDLAKSVVQTVSKESGGRQVPLLIGGLPEGTVLFPELPIQAVPEPAEFVGVREALEDGDALLALGRLKELPTNTGGEAAWAQIAGEVRGALETEGQRLLLRYLTGEEDAPSRSDFEEAARNFANARELGDSLELEARELFCRGRVLVMDAASRAQGLELLARAALYQPDAAWVFNAIGIAHLDAANHADAITAFRDAADRAPDWSYPLHNLAVALTALGDYDRAIKTYEDAIRLTPQFVYLPYNLGLLLQRLNRVDEARDWLMAARKQDPTHPWVWNALGGIEAQLGHYDKAREAYQNALILDGDFAAARHNLALALKASGHIEDAKCEWRLNVNNDRAFLPSFVSLASELNAGNRTERAEAIKLWRHVLSVNKKYSAGHVALAELLVEEGDSKEAAKHVDAAEPATFWKARLVRSRLSCGSGDLNSAEREYKAALAAALDDAAIKYIERYRCDPSVSRTERK